MLGWTALFEAVGSIFKPVADTLDNLHTSEEERLEAKAKLTAVQAEVALKWMDLEKSAMDLQAKITNAEMQHGNCLSRSWRPITMLTFLGLMVLHFFGLTPENMSPIVIEWTMEIIKWGLSGYVIGRSAEKVVPKIVNAMKKPEG